MSGVLITGTDTGVGKTIVCRHLGAYLQGVGLKVITQKWVQTGCGSSDDIKLHAISTANDIATAGQLADLRVPYRLGYPASPHLAAALEGVRIDIAKIVDAYARLAQHFDLVIVEGSGGALVPITETVLLADVAVRLNLPVVIVAHNQLGCINHTLLTAEALRARGLRVIGLIYNRIGREADTLIHADNIRITTQISRIPVLGELPHLADPQDAGEQFKPIGDAFYREWRNVVNE